MQRGQMHRTLTSSSRDVTNTSQRWPISRQSHFIFI
jgi:hypothetical protein